MAAGHLADYAGYADPTGSPVPPSPSGREAPAYALTTVAYDALVDADEIQAEKLYVVVDPPVEE